MFYISYHFVKWTEDFYRIVKHGCFLDSISPLSFNLLKDVYVLGSVEKLNTHHGNTFWTEWKWNALIPANCGTLSWKYGNRSYFPTYTPVTAATFPQNACIQRNFAKIYTAFSSLFVHPCDSVIEKFWTKVRPVKQLWEQKLTVIRKKIKW